MTYRVFNLAAILQLVSEPNTGHVTITRMKGKHIVRQSHVVDSEAGSRPCVSQAFSAVAGHCNVQMLIGVCDEVSSVMPQ